MADWKNNARFNKVWPYVLAVEGGYLTPEKAKQVGDKGGATNFGIAFNYNQGYLKQYNILLPAQMGLLTREQALEIYYRKYWLPSQADEIPDIRLAAVYFDHTVNAGQGSADKLLASLGRDFWHFEGDGKNVNYFWKLTLIFMLQRLWFYLNLKQWPTFGLGWYNRLIKIGRVLDKL